MYIEKYCKVKQSIEYLVLHAIDAEYKLSIEDISSSNMDFFV